MEKSYQDGILEANGEHLQNLNKTTEHMRKAIEDNRVATEKLHSWFTDGGFRNEMTQVMAANGSCADKIGCQVDKTNACIEKLSSKIQWIILPIIGVMGTIVTILFWVMRSQ